MEERGKVYEAKTHNLNSVYRVWQKKWTPKNFRCFLSNGLEF